MSLTFVSLASGSKGNSSLIFSENTAILVDAGITYSAIATALREFGLTPSRIDGVVITHEHSDHIRALPVFLKKYPVPVHVTQATAAYLQSDPVTGSHLALHRPIYTEQVGRIRVTSFCTPHDSICPVGFRIEVERDGQPFRIGYATDLGYVSPEVENGLFGCDAAVLESNHDPQMLREGNYPEDLKRRIASRRGHLSNPDCAAFAAKLRESGTRRFLLAHRSRENNTPDLAIAEFLRILPQKDLTVRVAEADTAVELPLE